MKKIILVLFSILIIGFIGFWINEMYQFAYGVKKDAVYLEKTNQKNKIKNGDIIFQT